MKKQIVIPRDYSAHMMEELFIECDEPGRSASFIPLAKILEGINGGAVCIAAGSCTDVIANEICGTLNHREVRQYLLLSDKKSSKRILGGKYVRILDTPQNGMAVVHVLNKKARAWLFSDAMSTSGYEVSGEDTYRTFCNLFWSKRIDCEYRGDDMEREPDSPLSQDISVDDRCSMPGQATDLVERYSRELYLQDPGSDVSSKGFTGLHISDTPGSERACLAVTGSADLFVKGAASGFSLVGDGKAGYLLPG
jgi:hypothetical protein